MQIVDVLGDDRRDLAGLVERGQRAMPAAGLGRSEGLFHRKAPPPGLGPRRSAGNEFVERDRAVTRPQAAGRAEIRNAAFGGNAGSGKGNDTRRFGDHVAELLDAATQILGNHAAASETVGRADYSTAVRIARSMRPAGAACASSGPPLSGHLIDSRPLYHAALATCSFGSFSFGSLTSSVF